MPEPLIIVARRGVEYVATAAGSPHEGVSQTSARCAAIHFLERVHGARHFLKFQLHQESAVFRLEPVPAREWGGSRG